MPTLEVIGLAKAMTATPIPTRALLKFMCPVAEFVRIQMILDLPVKAAGD